MSHITSTAYKNIDDVLGLYVKKRKTPAYHHIFQIAINIIGIYLVNKIHVDVWRSLTGH